jgi:AcrR family transcriptional regulator
MAKVRGPRSQARRAEILKVAADLFLSQGYETVSVDAIVDRAGGTKTNIYTMFGSKADLLGAVVDEQCKAAAVPFAGVAAGDTKLQAGLQEIGQQYLTALYSKNSIRLHRLMIAEAPRFAALSRKWFNAYPEAARRALASYFVGHKIASRGAELRLAGIFLGMLAGEQLVKQLAGGAGPPAPADIKDHVRQCVSMFLDAVQPKG